MGSDWIRNQDLPCWWGPAAVQRTGPDQTRSDQTGSQLVVRLLFILTPNGFLPGGSGTTKHNARITHITQNNTPHSNKTQHTTLHKQQRTRYTQWIQWKYTYNHNKYNYNYNYMNYISEDRTLTNRRCENLKSYICLELLRLSCIFVNLYIGSLASMKPWNRYSSLTVLKPLFRFGTQLIGLWICDIDVFELTDRELCLSDKTDGLFNEVHCHWYLWYTCRMNDVGNGSLFCTELMKMTEDNIAQWQAVKCREMLKLFEMWDAWICSSIGRDGVLEH
jgi:hypothetical protein